MDSPRVPSAAEEARAQMQILNETNRINQENAARERERLQAEKDQRIANATAKRNTAYQAASDYDNRQAAYHGYDQSLLDKYNVSSIYQDAIDEMLRGMGAEDENPVFGTSNAYSNAVSTGQSAYRNDLNKAINEFAGDDFAQKTFGSTADDAVLSAILTGQYDDAAAQLNAAHERGTLTDAGFAKAMAKLDNAKVIGDADLQKIGGGVLSTNRETLTNYGTGIRNKANAATFDNPYDVSIGQAGLADLTKQLTGSLEGDIRSAVGDQQFFDPSAIIGYGTTQQGYYNPSKPAVTGTDAEGNPLQQAFTDQNKKTDPLTSSGGSTF